MTEWSVEGVQAAADAIPRSLVFKSQDEILKERVRFLDEHTLTSEHESAITGAIAAVVFHTRFNRFMAELTACRAISGVLR